MSTNLGDDSRYPILTDDDVERIWQEHEAQETRETQDEIDACWEAFYDQQAQDDDEETDDDEDYEEGDADDCATDFIEPYDEDLVESFDDPAWCYRCHKDTAFCSCVCEQCGKAMIENGTPGDEVCYQCQREIDERHNAVCG